MKTVKLITEDGGEKDFDLRPPSAHDFFEIGEPLVLARTGDGALYSVENDGAIRLYIERCAPGFMALPEARNLANAIRVKMAVLDFFTDARTA
jgi:hypothetical protein